MKSKPINLLLLWDAHFVHHDIFNEALIRCLASANQLEIITCSDYINARLRYLSSVRYSRSRSKALFSKRLALLRILKSIVKGKLGKPRDPSYLTEHNVSTCDVESLVANTIQQDMRQRIRHANSEYLYQLEYQGCQVGHHLCVDLSLDCKSTANRLAMDSPELHNLRDVAYYSCLMLEALERYFQQNNQKAYQVLSTSVYSLDWVCRDYALYKGHQHLFVEQVADQIPGCKVYTSYSEDLVLRRECQETQVYDSKHLGLAIEYALSYLEKRLSPRSAHTYSPLSSRTSELCRLGEIVHVNPEAPIWVYYTNSPDELVSIAHDHKCASLGDVMPWDDTGVAQDEISALEIVAKMAHKLGALLIIRQHPRLGPETRSSFQSSEYPLLSDRCLDLAQAHPDNVLIFEPWSSINSYELALLSDRVISFRGTMPLEVSLLGIRPLVLAVNKGYMNYSIKLHAKTAPRSLQDFQAKLEHQSCCYDSNELATFLIQFYVTRRLGVIPLVPHDSSSPILRQAIQSRTSIPSPPEHKKNGQVILDQFEPDSMTSVQDIMIRDYLAKAYGIAMSAFGLTVGKS